MIFFLNVSDSGPFIQIVFDQGSNFFHSLMNLIQKLGQTEQKKFLAILNNLFLDEYKMLFIKKTENEIDQSLLHLFINNQIYFSNFLYEPPESNEIKDCNYIINKLSKFEFSYDNFFKDKIIDNIKEKRNCKLNIALSIIRIVFSTEKLLYIDETSEESKYFEYEFIKNLIDTNLQLTKKKYGSDVLTLFRKEDIFDDLIKYIFYIFGNTMMIESFVKPVEKMIKKIGLDEESIKNNILSSLDLPLVRDINGEEFEILIKEICENLNKTIPQILKIFLKLLYNSVIKYYNIDKNNFGPLYTSLFFNYILNPKMQEIYQINPMKILFVRSLNRLIKNTCFNYKINENDSLSKFNDLIEKYHPNLKKLIIDNVINIDENDEKTKNYLKELFTEKNLIYPKFLFYNDCKLILNTIKN